MVTPNVIVHRLLGYSLTNPTLQRDVNQLPGSKLVYMA